MLSLIIFIFALTTAWTAVAFSSRFVEKEQVSQALEVLERYRQLLEEARTRPRARKKLTAMKFQYKRARRIIFVSSLKKILLMMIAYVISSIVVVFTLGTNVVSPIYVPGFTVSYAGVEYMPTVTIHFLGYLYSIALFRKELIF
ncbi:MAG: hypothetical protein F7C32_04210 [Desulfurococcales archaeon]|nr:hypothetical protein [Desulfurococcales archaeon]